jgi:tricorn protease-like protein
MVLRTRQHDEGDEMYVMLNLQTHEMNEIFSAEYLKVWGLKWSPDGRQIAYSRPKELFVYKLDEKEIKKIGQRNYDYEIGFDWTLDGKKFVLHAPVDGEDHLVVMDEDFEEIKNIKIPVQFEGSLLVWGLENQALLKGTGKGALWRVDLETEDWKRVY